MFSSMTALSLLLSLVIFSVLVAILANIVSTDSQIRYKIKNEKDKQFSMLQNQDYLTMNDEFEHLMWFIQISDIHISMFNDKNRIKELNNFVNETLDIIEPSVVLASGDITDARDSNHLGSRQYIKEWQIYEQILKSNNISKKTIWLDIRGNHDNFNVPGVNSNLNYFKNFSIRGSMNQRSYLYQKVVNSDKYSFIAVDACLEPGPKRPFNFIGFLNTNDTKNLIELNKQARENGGNYTVWFGHYPTSCIMSPGAGEGGVRDIIGNFDESFVYLCGHLHTQGGLVPKMYTIHKTGFLELELGDWKDNRLFRVAAFDHGLFSFVDVTYNKWPIVLITNPKNVLFNIPGKENINLQLNSTYIRLLVFSPYKVVYCGIQIENEEWVDCNQKSKNLFVVPWFPRKYEIGIHYMNIKILTENGQSKYIKHEFSLDGTRLNFSLLGRFILMIDVNQIFQAFFGIALLLCVLPLCIFRILHELVRLQKLSRPPIKILWLKHTIRKMWILSSVNRIFMPIILHCVYIAIGPWSIGEVIDGHIGVIFVWGIFVNHSYIPGTLTYLYGFFQLIFCQLPLLFIYANILYERYRSSCFEMYNKNKLITEYFKHLPFVLIIFTEIMLASFFWWAHGTLALILGPFRTWSVILHILLWYLCINIPEKSLRSAIQVWNT